MPSEPPFAVQRQVGTDEVIAGVLPAEKRAYCSPAFREGSGCYGGDGINDARHWLVRMWALPLALAPILRLVPISC